MDHLKRWVPYDPVNGTMFLSVGCLLALGGAILVAPILFIPAIFAVTLGVIAFIPDRKD